MVLWNRAVCHSYIDDIPEPISWQLRPAFSVHVKEHGSYHWALRNTRGQDEKQQTSSITTWDFSEKNEWKNSRTVPSIPTWDRCSRRIPWWIVSHAVERCKRSTAIYFYLNKMTKVVSAQSWTRFLVKVNLNCWCHSRTTGAVTTHSFTLPWDDKFDTGL